MTPDEINEWCAVVMEGFTDNEIEQLEVFAAHMFSYVDKGARIVQLPPRLVLEMIEEYEQEDDDDV